MLKRALLLIGIILCELLKWVAIVGGGVVVGCWIYQGEYLGALVVTLFAWFAAVWYIVFGRKLSNLRGKSIEK